MPSPQEREAALFALAVEKPVAERAAFLQAVCGNDSALRQRLDALLAAHDQPEELLGRHDAQATVKATMKIDLVEEAPDEAVGQTLGRYKLLERVGEGGCGVVYVAEQTEPVRRRVALKVIKLGMDTKQVVARFEAERQALAMMDHPNIAKVLDAGTTEVGRPYFVMELVRGIRITEYCDQAQLSTKERLDLFIKVCQAIQHAHQKGIIHRDIKPSNILVTLHDGVPVPKVIDFGIAKATEGRLTDATVYTQLHQFIGTPAYMSPEQAEMSGLDIDTRSDIYSLGVLLYELLAGSTPFDARELMASGIDQMRKMIREKEPMRPSTRLATLKGDLLTTTAKRRSAEAPKLIHLLKGDLDWIVMKCLEKDRARRYDTANGLAMDIKRHLDNEAVVARPPTVAYRFQKSFRRNKLVFTAATAVALALLIGLAVSTWQMFAARRAQRETEAARNGEQQQRLEAQKKQAEAEAERQRADAQARKATESEQQSLRLLYAADMNLAQQALNANDLGRARRLLDRHRPAANAAADQDLRGWEWRFLWQRCLSSAITLTTHSERVYSLSFSPSGRRLAIGYRDGRVELWDMATRRLERVLRDKGGLGRVAFSPRADLLATSGDGGGVNLYDLERGTEEELCKLSAPLRDLRFSKDGKFLSAMSDEAKTVCVVNLEDKSIIRVPFNGGIAEHSWNAQLTRDGRRLLYTDGSGDKAMLHCETWPDRKDAWPAKNARLASGIVDYSYSALALSPDERLIATGTAYAGTPIRIWNAETGETIRELDGHAGWIGSLEFSPDGTMLASASADQTVRLWDTQTWKPLGEPLRGHANEVHTAAFSPDGRMLASGCKDGVVLLWDLRAERPKDGRRAFPKHVVGVKALRGGEAVLARSRDNKWSRFDLATLRETPLVLPEGVPFVFRPPYYFGFNTGTNFQVYEVLATAVKHVAESPPGADFGPAFAFNAANRLLAVQAGTKRICLLSLNNPAKRLDLNTPFDEIVPLSFGGDGRFLVAGNARERRVAAWDVDSGKLLTVAENDRSVISGFIPISEIIAPVGHALVTTVRSNIFEEIFIRNLGDPVAAPARIFQRGIINRQVFSPDGHTFATPTEDGRVFVYDTDDPGRIRTLDGHREGVFGAAFTDGGRRLATTSGSRQAALLWDLGTQQELLTLPGIGSLLGVAEFTDDGNTLLLGPRTSIEGACQFWRAPSWAEIEAAEHRGEGWTRTEK